MNLKILKLKVTNLYLVRAGEKCLLVDTGYEYEWELFCRRLTEAGARLDEIGWVLLTHHNDDHSGLLNRIVDSNPGVRVILSDLGKEYMAAGSHFHTPEASYVIPVSGSSVQIAPRMVLSMGGTMEGNARAQAGAWQKAITFFSQGENQPEVSS